MVKVVKVVVPFWVLIIVLMACNILGIRKREQHFGHLVFHLATGVLGIAYCCS